MASGARERSDPKTTRACLRSTFAWLSNCCSSSLELVENATDDCIDCLQASVCCCICPKEEKEEEPKRTPFQTVKMGPQAERTKPTEQKPSIAHTSQAAPLTTPPKERQEHKPSIQHPKAPEPPKIDFVETGSIFGDRKRLMDQSMLLLENGRFKSPGLSRITQGPGGRVIRVSFQTGFPSIRSIESRRSIESNAEAPPVGEVTPKNGETSSIESKSQMLKVVKSTKSSKSYRSMKSYISKGSQGRDFERPGSEPTNDPVGPESHD